MVILINARMVATFIKVEWLGKTFKINIILSALPLILLSIINLLFASTKSLSKSESLSESELITIDILLTPTQCHSSYSTCVGEREHKTLPVI